MQMGIEEHPLKPFVPEHAKTLMLGSFPPSRKRWSIEFFYPNLQNDMWRVFGLLFVGDKDALVDRENKRFRKEEIEALLIRLGIAIYDTAVKVVRTKGTAADNDLEIVEETDLEALLARMEECRTIVCTGGKSAEVCAKKMEVEVPKVGGSVEGKIGGRKIVLWRMPSTSRAYPMKIEKKAEMYKLALMAK